MNLDFLCNHPYLLKGKWMILTFWLIFFPEFCFPRPTFNQIPDSVISSKRKRKKEITMHWGFTNSKTLWSLMTLNSIFANCKEREFTSVKWENKCLHRPGPRKNQYPFFLGSAIMGAKKVSYLTLRSHFQRSWNSPITLNLILDHRSY